MTASDFGGLEENPRENSRAFFKKPCIIKVLEGIENDIVGKQRH